MHDVSHAALITRLDLPAKDLMSKLDSVFSTVVGNDPAMESEVMSALVGPDGHVDTPEQTGEHEPGATDLSLHITDKTDTPQPVTPETPKVQEMSADKSVTQNTERKRTTPPPQGDGAAIATPDVKKNLQNLSLGDARPNRGRILSLDRGGQASNDADGYQSPDTTPHTDDERHRRHSHDGSSQNKRNTRKYHDDASSSDDDSSYFATNLPSPKSGRSFSYSSTGSAPARTSSGSFYQNSVSRSSDASLSFSDESEDDMQHPGVHISPMIQPKGTVADMHLYPQRITRMHSVSSLVSSASSEDERPTRRMSSTSSMSSHTTTGTSSDPSVRAELHDMAIAAAEARPASHTMEASGRRSPVMGQHASPGYFFASPSPGRLKQSPPPIMQGYVPPQGVPHPHPQPMSHDQMAAWISAGKAAQAYQGGQPSQGYASMQMPQQTLRGMVPHAGGFRNISDQSNLTLPFVYSEDDVTDEGLINRFAGGMPSFEGQISMNAGPVGNQPTQQQMQPPYGNGGGRLQEANGSSRSAAIVASAPGEGGEGGALSKPGDQNGFQVYWQRWIMLLYMSLLNLLSDWTCYSVASIALLTEEAFGNIDPELLVVVFLGANALSTACEPIILARLGLRRTVLFGSLMLMIGSIVKSGGVPPILKSDIRMGHDEWRLYLGFFIVGLSQPLYQCTPALLSASWFPEKERTMATGVALNANQLGIGFSFIFGTLLVSEKEDIIPYFGLLSTLSTLLFVGTLIQFDDAPPTPPSSSARVMRGSLEVNLPSIDSIVQSVRGLGGSDRPNTSNTGGIAGSPSPAASHPVAKKSASDTSRQRRDTKSKKSGRSSSGRKGGTTRRRAAGPRSQTANTDSGLLAPSSARSGPTAEVAAEIAKLKSEARNFGVDAPSPVMPGRVGQPDPTVNQGDDEASPLYEDAGPDQEQEGLYQPGAMGDAPTPPQGQPGPYGATPPPGMVPPFGALPHPHYQYPYWDPRVQQQMQQQQAYYQQQHYYYYHQQAPQPPQPYYYPLPYTHHLEGYDMQNAVLPAAGIDEGAEPIVTITAHHLDIDIRDDQVLLSIRACLKRPGFIHALVAFTVSGIVINTLSTYMDYLVRLNGAPSYYTGIVGGTFQFVIMISSLIIGKQTDKTRAYYSVTIGMLVLGAFGLAECGVSLDADRGSDLRWSLVIVAALVGPLQPVSTELGVDVAYPLSENTVLVIQQLFSNLLSALFIPIFKALKDFGASNVDDTDMVERPAFTFSFYLLIVLHTSATVFFATFNGKYLRYEHELQKKAEEERLAMESVGANAFHPFYSGQQEDYGQQIDYGRQEDYGQQKDYGESNENERQPLVNNPIV